MKYGKITYLKYIVLTIQIGIMIWLCSIKPGINEDEIWTFFISNQFVTLKQIKAERMNLWSSVSEILNVMWMAKPHCFDYSFISEYAAFDVHPPLYNILLHTICSLFYRSGFSLWYGYGLNIVLFILNYLVTWKVAKAIFDDRIALLTCTLYGFSLGVFNSVCFIRFYILASVFAIMALYLHFQLWKTKQRKYFFLIAINAILGMYTFYPFGVYMFFLAFAELLILGIEKRTHDIKNYIIAIAVAAILFLMIFPQSISQVLYGVPGSGYRDMSRTYVEDFILFLKIISRELFGNKMPVVLGLMVIMILFSIGKNKDRLNKIKPYFMLFVPIIGYLIVMAKMTPFNTTGRYHSIIYPIIIVAVYGTLGYMIIKVTDSILNENNRYKHIIISVAVSLLLIPVCFWYMKINPLYNIEYLQYQSKDYVELAENHKTADCVCILDDTPLKLFINYGELKCFTNIMFTNQEGIMSLTDPKLQESDELVVYITQGLDKDKIVNKLLENNSHIKNVQELYQFRYADVIYLSAD